MNEIPDEHGLSSDSMRGTHHFIRPDLVGAQDSKDPMTGRPNSRAKLSANEIYTLEAAGMLVDADGYEREPEPVEQVAPQPVVQPRVRQKDRAPAGETLPHPAYDPTPVPVAEDSTQGAARPYGTSNPPLTQQNREHPSQGVVRPDGEPYGSVTPIPPYGGEPTPSVPTPIAPPGQTQNVESDHVG